jgi:uncharacterized protein YpmS
MSRQDQDLSSSDPWQREKNEKEKLKEELREEVLKEIKRKKRRKTLSCCLLELSALLLILFLGFAAVAKAGLVEIPFFSKVFYKPPEPSRIVTVLPGEIKNLEKIFEDKIKTQVEEKMIPGKETQKVDVELEFTEKELTAAMLDGINSGFLPFSTAQIAVTSKEIEIFGQLSGSKIFFTISFKPEIENDQLVIKLTKFKLGNLPLPSSLANLLVEKILKDKMQQINEFVGKGGKLQEIRLEEGKVIIRGTIDIMIFLQK